MQSKSIYKVPKGKLLKIFLNYDEKNNLIKEISITGDFFAYPEEAIDLMENKLKNTLLKKEILLNKINSIIKKHNIQFIGLNAEGLTEGILICTT
jgi:lipoate-protein ligase A